MSIVPYTVTVKKALRVATAAALALAAGGVDA